MNERDIFIGALQCDAAKRRAFLDEACGVQHPGNSRRQ